MQNAANSQMTRRAAHFTPLRSLASCAAKKVCALFGGEAARHAEDAFFAAN